MGKWRKLETGEEIHLGGSAPALGSEGSSGSKSTCIIQQNSSLLPGVAHCVGYACLVSYNSLSQSANIYWALLCARHWSRCFRQSSRGQSRKRLPPSQSPHSSWVVIQRIQISLEKTLYAPRHLAPRWAYSCGIIAERISLRFADLTEELTCM